jgi:hypothetical protein
MAVLRILLLRAERSERLMSFKLSKTGDWNIAQKVLNGLTKKLYPAFSSYVDEAGQMFIDRILYHMDAQDLNWTPLSPRTIELKGGSETILVDTGLLRNSIQAVKIQQSKSVYGIFVGALNSVRTDTGVSLGDLMMWIEYGTDKMVARPLLRPSWNEVRGKVTKEALNVLKNLVMNRW